jgi:hypothetical protein
VHEPRIVLHGAFLLSKTNKATRAVRFGRPRGRITQSERSMGKQTFDALGRILCFMCDHLTDAKVPQSIEEDGAKVKEWIDNYKKIIR